MKKLLGIILLGLAFFAPDLAQAASRYLTCTTACTITAADQTIWCSDAGRTTCTVSVPTTTDDVILDASTCVGGTTCTATFGAGYNPTWISVTMSACTASTSGCILDANPNGNTITLTGANALINSGAGTRTVSGGTWVLSGNTAIMNFSATATVTNSPSISFTGTGGTSTSRKDFLGGGKTYGTVSFSGNANAVVRTGGSNTIGTLTVNGPNRVYWSAGTTNTITTITNISASSSSPVLFTSDNPVTGVGTLSSGNNWACDWCGFYGMTFSGAGTFSATNSLDFGGNTNIAITPPSGGGVSNGHNIIGG